MCPQPSSWREAGRCLERPTTPLTAALARHLMSGEVFAHLDPADGFALIQQLREAAEGTAPVAPPPSFKPEE